MKLGAKLGNKEGVGTTSPCGNVSRDLYDPVDTKFLAGPDEISTNIIVL
jgi:hypothetical protein